MTDTHAPTLDELRQAVIDAATNVAENYEEYMWVASVALGRMQDLSNTLDALSKAEAQP